MLIGERIEELRNARGWTRAELAYRAGITESHLSNIVKGKNLPGLSSFYGLCAAFGVAPEELMLDVEWRVEDLPDRHPDRPAATGTEGN